MTSPYGRRMLHLAAALDPGAEACTEAVRLAECGGLDFVTLAGPDAPSALSRAAALTGRIGLVAEAATGAAAYGRAGLLVEEPQARARPPAEVPDPYRRTAEASVLVVDAGPGRGDSGFAARYADVALVRAAGPAQARVARGELRRAAAESGRDPDTLRVLASLRIDLGGGEHAAEPGHGGGGPRHTAQGPLYRGGPVDLAELMALWHTEGAADGFHVTPVEPPRDLERFVNATVALLQHRGLFRTFYPGGTLREHLGLPHSVNTMERSIT
ncbi:FMNH2-dependent monooxygenase [Streptomyces sp. NPDC005017]|uniref:FMNH2-dependent monooxygenase n=1 Tax=Streptomyces sp. NPDC005017 TaxID=3364706 RepID=UPI00367370AD